MTRHEQLLDKLRAELVIDDWIAVRDLHDRGYRFRHSTLARGLVELVKLGDAARRWDGNSRFGRFLYRATQ